MFARSEPLKKPPAGVPASARRQFRNKSSFCFMKIEIKKLKHLVYKYTDEFKCQYHTDVVIDGKKNRAGSDILFSDLDLLAKAGYKELEVMYNVTMYEYLIREFPVDYRRPDRWIDSSALDRYLEGLEEANMQSGRKRFLYIVGDVFLSHGKSPRRDIVFRHGDMLDYQKWRTNKIYVPASQRFFLRSSEIGIIIFGGVKFEDYGNVDDGYKKKVNLVGSMLAHRSDKKFEISPDFIPNKDVHTVSIPGKLVEEYMNTNTKLIILGENLTVAHKEALLLVKQHDPFVRMMVTPPINPQNIDHVLLQIKMMYNTDRWERQK